jgi:hypothetical protein
MARIYSNNLRKRINHPIHSFRKLLFSCRLVGLSAMNCRYEHRSPLRTLGERCGKNEVAHRSPHLLPEPLGEPNTAIFFRAFPLPQSMQVGQKRVIYQPTQSMVDLSLDGSLAVQIVTKSIQVPI